MPSTKQILAALGDDEQTFPVESLGQTWLIAMPDQVVIGEYEEWLEMDARNRLEQRRDKISKDAYAIEGSRIDAAAASGQYEWKSEYWATVLRSPKGVLKLISLMLGVRHKDMTIERAREIYDGNSKEMNRAFTRALKASDPFFSFLPDFSEDSATMTTDQSLPPGNGNISTSA